MIADAQSGAKEFKGVLFKQHSFVAKQRQKWKEFDFVLDHGVLRITKEDSKDQSDYMDLKEASLYFYRAPTKEIPNRFVFEISTGRGVIEAKEK